MIRKSGNRFSEKIMLRQRESRRRDRLDLDQKVGAIEFRHLDQRHRGRGRRRDGSKEAVSRLAVGTEMVDVGEEHRQLDQIGRGASAGLQRDREIVEHLRRLGGKIASADDIAVAIERGLTGDEDDPAGGYLNDLRIARRCAEFRRIDAGDGGGFFAWHSGGPSFGLSWPGVAVRRTASLPLAYVPAIHVLLLR